MTGDNDSVGVVARLLDQQRAALLQGDVATLAKLPERLDQAMRRLARARVDPVALADLAQIAARNAHLVLSARAGLARATHDRAPVTALTTYNAQGRKAAACLPGQMISRR